MWSNGNVEIIRLLWTWTKPTNCMASMDIFIEKQDEARVIEYTTTTAVGVWFPLVDPTHKYNFSDEIHHYKVIYISNIIMWFQPLLNTRASPFISWRLTLKSHSHSELNLKKKKIFWIRKYDETIKFSQIHKVNPYRFIGWSPAEKISKFKVS